MICSHISSQPSSSEILANGELVRLGGRWVFWQVGMGYGSFLVASQSAELSFAEATLAKHVSKRVSCDTDTFITQDMNVEAKLGQ